MRLVFLGTPGVAVPSLRALSRAGHEIPLVVSQPDRARGRSRREIPTPVKEAAQELGIETFQPTRVRNAAFRERLGEGKPDLLVVVAYGRILVEPVLELAPLGAVNLHFSLLPRYRGAAPVQWALARGEQVTGVTTMKISLGLDEGDILLQEELPVEPQEHAPALARRLSEIGARLLVRTLEEWEAITPQPQDSSRATLAPLLSRADGEIGPDRPAREIEGRVRGFDPWPGVWMRVGGRRMRIVRAQAVESEEPNAPAAGLLLGTTAGGVRMACGSASELLLEEIQIEGGRRMQARDAVNGRHLQIGDRVDAAKSED